VESPTDACHLKFLDPVDGPVKTSQVTLGNVPFTRVFTPGIFDYSGIDTQDLEYMTPGPSICVHISVDLGTHYFDRGNAVTGDMISVMRPVLDAIVSTFHWTQP
jgi:hypothetical protein